MDDCPGPEDKTAAEEGQGVDDGDDDTQKQGIGRFHHQHTDDGNGEGKAHQDELGFDIAPDGGLQFCFCGAYGNAQQGCQMFLIYTADKVTVFGKEVGGDQRNEEGDEEIGYAAQCTAAAALRDQGKQNACGIILKFQKRCLQFYREFPAEGIELFPEFLHLYLEQIHIVRQIFGKIPCLMQDAVAGPEAQ